METTPRQGTDRAECSNVRLSMIGLYKQVVEEGLQDKVKLSCL